MTQATWGPFPSCWLTENSVHVLMRSSTFKSHTILSLSLWKICILFPEGRDRYWSLCTHGWEKWNFLCPGMGQQREHKRWQLERVLGKKPQMGLCILKERFVPQKGKYGRIGHSSVLLWHGGKWWEKSSCCKSSKNQVIHWWRADRTLMGRWLRLPATLMLQQIKQWSDSLEGQSTQQHPLVAGEQRVTQIAGKWLSSTAGFRALCWNTQFCKYQFCWLCVICCACTEKQQKCREGCPSIQWLLGEQTMVFDLKRPLRVGKSA